jgi:hypothetical protein
VGYIQRVGMAPWGPLDEMSRKDPLILDNTATQ